MRSVMEHKFSNAPSIAIERSTFDRSHGHKTTLDCGALVPIFLDEALPGDTFNIDMAGFARLATPIFPIIDNMRMETFFFAVPYRLIWDNWKKLCGEQIDPGDTIDYLVPQITDYNNAANETIWDYFGLPTNIAANLAISALPLRAYYLIWNEWFRDQNLQDSLTISRDDGPDSMAEYSLQYRGKRHDYFTSALPWTQKGDDVLLSLGTSAPVTGIGKVSGTWDSSNVQAYDMRNLTGATTYAAAQAPSGAGNGVFFVEKNTTGGVGAAYHNIKADLSAAIGPSVNEFREAVQTQRILETDARSGTRYTEIIKSHFGVNSPDARLQRPEYLGGGSTPVNISAVANTSNTSTGKLGAMGVAAFKGHGFVKSFSEHCLVLGLVNVRADITYQQGLDRLWSRRTRYDHYWPMLSHLGEQAILNKEIYVSAADIADGTYNQAFGYQERYAEYRYKPSRITGKLRSNDAASLDAWHLGLEFNDTPALDDSFIVDNPPLDRCIGVPSEPHFILDTYFNFKAARPMPLYSIPGLVDHF